MAFRSVFKTAGLTSQYRSRLTHAPFMSLRPYSAGSKPTLETTTPTSGIVTESALTQEKTVEADKKELEMKEETKEEKKEDTKKPIVEQGYQYGAHHWNMERGAAIALIPLISTQMVYGAHPIVDGLMGVVLPYHIFLGFESCIIDYIPKRVYPRLHKAAMWTLVGTTSTVMWGCYEFNTNDIGITELIQGLFTA
ncbi:CybS-domain-containing protein [Sporodiniella umbellata]|nr:CybS-domain-containing protein [Sporodiniella umbellata]